MKNVLISREWSIELEFSGKLYQFLPAFCHTQTSSGLFALSPITGEENVN